METREALYGARCVVFAGGRGYRVVGDLGGLWVGGGRGLASLIGQRDVRGSWYLAPRWSWGVTGSAFASIDRQRPDGIACGVEGNRGAALRAWASV